MCPINRYHYAKTQDSTIGTFPETPYHKSNEEGDRQPLFQELRDTDIPYSIEPGVRLQSCEEVLQLCSESNGRIFPAVGIHPTRSIYEKWADRHKLDAFAKAPGVVAIGECGLDYCKDVIQPKPLRRARNTSLILPAVIQKNAEQKGVFPQEIRHTAAKCHSPFLSACQISYGLISVQRKQEWISFDCLFF